MYYLDRIKSKWIALPSVKIKEIEAIRKLNSLPLLVGYAVHQAIADYFRAVQAGSDLSEEEFYESGESALRTLLDKGNVFERTRLSEDEYDAKIADSMAKSKVLLGSFWSLPERQGICKSLCERLAESFIDHDSETGFIPECRVEGLKIYGTPDLVYLGGDGLYHVISWKTGNHDVDGFMMQLAAQVFFCIHNFGIEPERIDARVVNLNHLEGQPIYIQGASPSLSSFFDRMKKEVEDLRAMYEDLAYRIPKKLDQFSLAASALTCTTCKYCSMCEGPR